MSVRTDRHVALLRGVNVGGHNKLPMKELALLFVKAKCSDIATYIQSGNVVFSAPPALAARLPETIAAAIEKRFGFRSPVVIRSADVIAKVVRDNPFVKRGADLSTLHVVFLADTPAAARAAALDPKRSPGDRFELRGGELYLQLPNGVAGSKLTNDYLDRTLATISTARNWNTVRKLLELLEGGSHE